MIGIMFPILLLFCYFLWLFVGWSLFFVVVLMSCDSGWSNPRWILICLLSFWLIINVVELNYIILYYNTKLHYSRLSCLLMSLPIQHCFCYSLSIFIFNLLLVLLSPFKFSLISCRICCFISYFCYCLYYHF